MAKKQKARETGDDDVSGNGEEQHERGNEVTQALQTAQGIATMVVTVGIVAITAGMVHWHDPSTLDTMFSDPARSTNEQVRRTFTLFPLSSLILSCFLFACACVYVCVSLYPWSHVTC